MSEERLPRLGGDAVDGVQADGVQVDGVQVDGVAGAPGLPGGDEPSPPAQELEVLDPVALRRWAFQARAALAEHRRRIDALNVYPVPDGDTGTNMLHTLSGALRGLREHGFAHAPHEPGQEAGATATPGEATGAGRHEGDPRLEAVTRSTLLSARGNSGAILSELIRGLTQTLVSARGRVDGAGLARAMRTASERAWSAVGRPVEGTMLSVARAAAAAADRTASRGGRLAEVTGAAVEAARAALAATPEQLPTLKRAGVVDAGGAGLVVLLSSLHEIVTGRRGDQLPPALPDTPEGAGVVGCGHHGSGGSGGGEEQVEVTYLVHGVDEAARAALATELDRLGDSVVLAGDAERLRVHVHVAPDAQDEAVAAGRGVGRVDLVRIEHLTPAAVAFEAGSYGAHAADDPEPGPGRSGWDGAAGVPRLVTVLSADLDVEVPGRHLTGSADPEPDPVADASTRPRVGPLGAVLTDTAASPLVVLTDLPEQVATHIDAARADGIDVLLVAADSLPAALAAVAVHDPAHEPVADVQAMREAAAAVRAAVLWEGAPESPQEALGRLESLLRHPDGVEIVTLCVRPDADELARDLAERVRGRQIEVQTVRLGAGSAHALLAGVE